MKNPSAALPLMFASLNRSVGAEYLPADGYRLRVQKYELGITQRHAGAILRATKSSSGNRNARIFQSALCNSQRARDSSGRAAALGSRVRIGLRNYPSQARWPGSAEGLLNCAVTFAQHCFVQWSLARFGAPMVSSSADVIRRASISENKSGCTTCRPVTEARLREQPWTFEIT
jgi:hypothetical protein